MRRNRIKIFVAAALALVLALGCFAALAETLTVRFDLEYRYDMTQAMLPIINEYRTSDTWYWNKTDTEKIPVTGLNALIYDYGLEQIAMKRAAECALVFSHTRPNEQK